MADYALIRERGGGVFLARLQRRTWKEEEEEEELAVSRFVLLALARLLGFRSEEGVASRAPKQAAAVARLLEKEEGEEEAALVEALEVLLWGPAPSPSSSTEQQLQRWLDVERAATLNDILRKKGGLREVRLTLGEAARIAFLVKTSAGRIREMLQRLEAAGREADTNL